MADRTIKIEIPVEVLDNTSDGTKGVVQNLSKMEKAMLKMEKQSRQHTSKMEESFSKTDEKMERVHDVELRAEDNATPVIHNVEDALDRVAGTSADVELGADDSATPVIKGVEDSVTQTDGTSADVELGADDSATPVIKGVEDSAESLGGASATVELGAEDNASSIIDMVRDKLHSLGGMAVSAVVGAADTASEVIDSVLDKLSSYEGTTWNATVGVVNAVTSPIGKIGGVIGNPLAQAGAVAGVSFGVADSVNTFKDFEQMMSSVKAISSATAAEFDALTDKAKQMGADTKFSAYESAEAFNYMAMAGWKPQQMIDGIAGVMNLAAASGEDLGSTSDIVTDAITAFGMQAGDATHFADVLAQASANANTNVGMLGESFKYVAPVAGAMKYSVEDTSLALGLMANASIKGSMAGTALKTSIANMASPTGSVAAAMDKYGISLTETDGSMKSLKGVMDNLRTSLGGLSETEQTAAASTIFGKEAMSGMLAIINAAEEDYDKLTEAVYNADGASERMAETMMDNLAGSFELLSGAMDEAKMTLGDRLSPYLKSGADALAEFMPEVKAGVTEFMDFVDSKAEKMKSTITSMTNSEEWADADFLGKVDIAWNELIGEPFMDWATGDGAHLVSKGISSLFSSAVAILPGGEQAGLSSWLSAGLIAKGAIPMIETARKGIGLLSEISPIAGKAGLAATAAAAGITAIAIAIDDYNQKQIDDSLEKHFGQIELSAQQAKEFADQLLGIELKTNVETSLGEFRNAGQLREDAEAALAANDALEWKCGVGLTLTEKEGEDYKTNIETFIESKRGELESAAYAASTAIGEIIGGKNGEAIINAINSWAQWDSSDLSGLSSQLRTAVEEALVDGIVTVPEQEAINELQSKINRILSSWNATDAQTKMDLIQQKYGHLTGKDLTSGAFSEIVTLFQSSRESTEAEIEALSEEYYNLVNSAHSAGRLDDQGVKDWKGWWQEGVLNKRGGAIANALAFESNTLQDTYGAEITRNNEKSSQIVNRGIENQMNTLFASGSENVDLSTFQDYLHTGVGNQMGNASGALHSLYETMAPDVSAMGEIMDRYREEFGYVPKNLKEAYDEAIEIGAAAGNEDAAMQKYANALLENGSEEVVSALKDPSNPLYESIREASPELATAIDRALTETGESITIDDLMARIEKFELDDSSAKKSVEEALQAFEESVQSSGSEIEITTKGVQVTLGEIEVDGQSAIEQVAAAVNMTADELAQVNGYESAVEVPIGATIKIPPESITFDTSALEATAQEATDQANPAPVDAETSANVNVTETTTDTSGMQAQAEEDAKGAVDDIPAEGHATITITESTIVTTGIVEKATSEIESAVSDVPANGHTNITLDQTNNAAEIYSLVTADVESVFSQTIPTAGYVDVTLDQTNNVGAIYSEVDSEIDSKFSAGFSTSAHVDVTLDWAIVNPTANISVGGAGSGSASVSAAFHAEGGLFGNPHLGLVAEDGPEAIIPLGAKRRDRGIDLWMQAGAMLGISQYADGGIVGNSKYSDTLFESGSSTDSGKEASGDQVGISVESGNSNVQVTVNMAPTFEISNDDPDTVLNMVKRQLNALTNDMTAEIARRVADSFANTPA